MEHHFRAFSFVDRITSLEGDGWVHGSYQIPAGVNTFSSSLASEALGQLAAWASMSMVDFSHRPLAGIAGEVQVLQTPTPGQQLDLKVHLESVDADSVVYSGEASVSGTPVIRLSDCVGPMVPVVDFDDPAAVRERFELVRGKGAEPGGFQGLPEMPLQTSSTSTGETLQATLQVPSSAPFFEDHFPRRAVFPGTLLIHANLQLAQELVSHLPPPQHQKSWNLHTISGVKLRSFTSPGTALELKAETASVSANNLLVHITTRNSKRKICAATVEFTAIKS